MQKDLKTGIVAGMVLAAAAGLWLSTRPALSTKARMLSTPDAVKAGQPKQTVIEYLPPPAPSPAGPAQNPEPRKFHIVSRGETLSSIACRYYGPPGQWRKIYNANRSRIKDPDKVQPGTKLIIPDYPPQSAVP